jgi:Leucine-rich repeat (LRR) protein
MCWLILATQMPLVFAQQTEFTCDTVTEIPKIECEALVSLYQNTNGDNWYKGREGWLVTNTPCEWEGVGCYEKGHVIELYRSGGLNGPIPPELGNLTNLRVLDLGKNSLSGPIPPELGNLTNLKRLILNNNQLSGPIPPELGNLTELKRLFLNNNQLSGPIPSELGNIPLNYLNLSHNELRGALPISLIKLNHLDFNLEDTLLCQPNDAEFQAWWKSRRYSLPLILATCPPTNLPETDGEMNTLPSTLIILVGVELVIVGIVVGSNTRSRFGGGRRVCNPKCGPISGHTE